MAIWRSWYSDDWSKWLVQVRRVARSECPSTHGKRSKPTSKRIINRHNCQAMLWL